MPSHAPSRVDAPRRALHRSKNDSTALNRFDCQIRPAVADLASRHSHFADLLESFPGLLHGAAVHPDARMRVRLPNDPSRRAPQGDRTIP